MNRIFICTFVLLILSACGGGGSSSDSNPEKGVFIDSVVQGVTFKTETQSGTTDSDGSFNYLPGEDVSFYIGDILIGSATGETLMTPLDFVPGKVDITDPQVTNVLRFVQTLDSDSNPENGITISETVANRAIGQSLDFSLATDDFETAASALVSMLTSGEVTRLVDASTAQTHFIRSLGNTVATGDSYTTAEDKPLEVTSSGVLANDIDLGLGPLQVRLVGDVSNGQLTMHADGSFRYIPNLDFHGTDSFIYSTILGPVESSPTTVTITVTPVNDVTATVADGYRTLEDTPLVVTTAGVLSNDVDPDLDPVQARLIEDVSYGRLKLNVDGSFVYTPNASYYGADRFTYIANDGSVDSDPTSVFIWIDVNDPDDIIRLLLDEDSGVIAFDDSSMNNDGTFIGAPKYEASSGDGSALSLRLDGIDDYIDLGAIEVSGYGLTLATWFNADDLSGWHHPLPLIYGSSYPPGHSKYSTGKQAFVLDIVKQGNVSRLRASLRTGRKTTVLTAEAGDLKSGTWYHAALIYDGTRMRLFLDGVDVGRTSLSGSVKKAKAIIVGGEAGITDQFFAGRIDDVRISQRALSENELSMIVEGTRNQPIAPTRLSFSASPNIVSVANGTTTLNWNAPYAKRCTASGAWSGTRNTSGAESICAVKTESRFSLTCSGPGGVINGELDVSVVQNHDGTALLSWTPPTRNTDGSELTDLAGYRIYYGTSPGNYCNSISILISESALLSYLLDDLASTGWYFAMTAFNSLGIESNYSEEAFKVIE